MAKQRETKDPPLLWVDIREAAPNPLFTEAQRRSVRFLIYNRAVPCSECGRKIRKMWTMICEFRAPSLDAGMFAIPNSGKVHMPLSPVCDRHVLAPAFKKP